MARCSNTGCSNYVDTIFFGQCDACKQRELIENENEENRRHAALQSRANRQQQQEIADSQSRANRRQEELLASQNKIAQQNLEEQRKANAEQKKHMANQAKIERMATIESARLESLKIAELKEQNQLLLEQSVLDEEAYEQGNKLEKIIFLDPTNPNSEVLYQHEFEISFDEAGKVFAKSICPYFITPRLKTAFVKGVNELLSRVPNIDEEVLENQAYFYGKEWFKELNSGFALEHHLDRGDGVLYKMKSNGYYPEVSYLINPVTGEIASNIKDPNLFERSFLNDALLRGINECVTSLNARELCERRVEAIHNYSKLQFEIDSKNLEKERDFLLSHAKWIKREKIKSYIALGIRAGGFLISVLLWKLEHEFLAVIYLLLYLVAIVKLWGETLPKAPEPKKEPLETLAPLGERWFL